ncbi:inter-alpha-trypsin inhibitor domain-containing protein [Betaproteobacteria bacterium]|nr:inter-alpha-trypsin inhibitor domain-containing protein [Betaproteobacteria bacterium]
MLLRKLSSRVLRLGLRTAIVGWGCAGVLLGAAHTALAQEDGAASDRTESPYFFVSGADAAVDALPLKSTNVEVSIAGVIADVTVTQVYRNEGQRALEAKYLFPGSTRAAVHAMSVELGGRVIHAQIREKERARHEYEEAKSAGKTAALLEQHRPNVFQMNVSNIMPADEVRVELHYTELLVPEAGQYQFVFPAVVGPRYNSPDSESAQDKWVAQPVLRAGVETPAKFDLQVRLDTPVGLKEVVSPSHGIQVERADTHHARIGLQKGAVANNRDFILDYRLAGDAIESGVMLMRGEEENFFLAMVEPPQDVGANLIVPREYIFVVDISGSMYGFPLDTAKQMLRELIGGLRAGDTFNVLLFAGSSRFLNTNAVAATPENIRAALRLIDEQGGGGSTELMPALRKVYAQPKSADVSRTIVVVTDGYVTVEREAFRLVRQHLDEANLFAFGIGSSVNRHLMEGLARAGMGEPFIITRAEDARAAAQRFRRMVMAPVLTQVAAQFSGVEVYDVAPEKLPDVLGERPVILFGKWRDGGQGGAPYELVVSGHNANGPYRQRLPLLEAVGNSTGQYGGLRHLWARQRIAELSDQENLEGDRALRGEITRLGLKYSLLTQYTSFVAIDQRVRRPAGGELVSVDQPQPLPAGTSNLAVSGNVPSSPEPESLGALLVMLSMLAMVARRRYRQRQHHLTA